MQQLKVSNRLNCEERKCMPKVSRTALWEQVLLRSINQEEGYQANCRPRIYNNAFRVNIQSIKRLALWPRYACLRHR